MIRGPPGRGKRNTNAIFGALLLPFSKTEMLSRLALKPATSTESFDGKRCGSWRSRVARRDGSKPLLPRLRPNLPPELPGGLCPLPPGPGAAEKREKELSDPQGCPESSRAEGVGRWAPARSGRKGRGKSARRGRDLRDAAVPGLRETAAASQGRGGDVPSRPRLRMRAKGCGPPRRKARTAGPRFSRGCLVLPGSAVHTSPALLV